ncbi:hypothetical protein [Variovorax sp. OV329]|uniref:hypothetical protein n=1 Tax=Variovorax sp. OV329 TaxID=1882825 RepID=UPI0008EC2625|nr:hypothetical protein [Variovorax sp. OV329]SFM94659.1 hypothetical protein SAMN05444747_111170 [Variovorax sp. OV329]
MNLQPLKLLVLGAACAVAVGASAAEPYGLSHPNFQAAEDAAQAAINHIHGAQNVNGPTFGGHAGRAIELLQQAQSEIAIADQFHQGRRW